MQSQTKDTYGPRGDSTHHRPLNELRELWRVLPASPADSGSVALIVRRRKDHVREILDRVCLTPKDGMPGDGWGARRKRDVDAQLAVMQHPVAELIANGQALTTFGDNLFVDLDLSDANLPTGSQLRVGEAIVEVTPLPHNGCRKFNARFGADAYEFVQAEETRDRNLRGVYWKVVESGEVWVGAPIEVLSRGAADGQTASS